MIIYTLVKQGLSVKFSYPLVGGNPCIRQRKEPAKPLRQYGELTYFGGGHFWHIAEYQEQQRLRRLRSYRLHRAGLPRR